MLRRKTGTIPPKPVIWVFCEGKRTEPDYLNWFSRKYGQTGVVVKTVPECGVPKTIVETAKKKKKELDREAKRVTDSFRNQYKVWAMCDVDEHPRVDEARIQAQDNHIGFALSNPCVELWAILHLADQTAHIDRHRCQSRLKELMPKYDHKGSATFDTSLLVDRYDDARFRATNLCNDRRETGDPGGNPSTTVWELTDEIITGSF